MRDKKYRIEIQKLNNTIVTIDGVENENILEVMIQHDIRYRSDCGGRGTCGKCKVQVIKGEIDISPQDRKIFTTDELQRGYRLSCKAFPKENCTIILLSKDDEAMEIVTDISRQMGVSLKSPQNYVKQEENYVIGIDLGTTTIAISLVGITSKRLFGTYTTINPQRSYGADVISRMKASNEGKKVQLQEAVLKSLLEGINTVILEAGIEESHIKRIAIAGNTTMGHLFMGYSCETLGVFPFQPVNIGTIEVIFKDIFMANSQDINDLNDRKNLKDVPVILLPGISTFVGGDIIAGLMVCGFDTAEEPSLLIDLGTNGEMAIGNKDYILVTSTAAGPAFEGGNISCGIGSVPGAISHVRIHGDGVSYETIGHQPPIGICGTGVVEIASELLKVGFVDGTGLLIEEYFVKGFPITENEVLFTQKDIRELQLAKAAVRAGIELLAKSYGITLQEIDKVYLAGGFGYKIDVEKAIHIGLLPEELRGRIKVIGNSSLAGAVQYLTDSDEQQKIEHILEVSKEIHLSNDADFNELYLKYMSFYEEE